MFIWRTIIFSSIPSRFEDTFNSIAIEYIEKVLILLNDVTYK